MTPSVQLLLRVPPKPLGLLTRSHPHHAAVGPGRSQGATQEAAKSVSTAGAGGIPAGRYVLVA